MHICINMGFPGGFQRSPGQSDDCPQRWVQGCADDSIRLIDSVLEFLLYQVGKGCSLFLLVIKLTESSPGAVNNDLVTIGRAARESRAEMERDSEAIQIWSCLASNSLSMFKPI